MLADSDVLVVGYDRIEPSVLAASSSLTTLSMPASDASSTVAILSRSPPAGRKVEVSDCATNYNTRHSSALALDCKATRY